jgi:hypothetical protein
VSCHTPGAGSQDQPKEGIILCVLEMIFVSHSRLMVLKFVHIANNSSPKSEDMNDEVVEDDEGAKKANERKMA